MKKRPFILKDSKGITIIHKSHLKKSKPTHRKLALVLAGGMATGGAYKVGGLRALEDLFLNKFLVEFDTFVGVSAGAVLASALAGGISPKEMFDSLDGKSDRFSQLKPWDFYFPNFKEFVVRPTSFLFDLAMYSPRALKGIAESFTNLDINQRNVKEMLDNPSWRNFQKILEPYENSLKQPWEMIGSSISSAIFENSKLETYLRRNMERNQIPNNFVDLFEQYGSDLYVTAMNLNTAKLEIFGHDENNRVTVSKAVQASAALPGFYKPVKIGNETFVDGAIIRTANISIAVNHGADLIICYNPFRPIVKPVDLPGRTSSDEIAHGGLFSIVNQIFRALLHSRLRLALHRFVENPSFTGDIILVEPAADDFKFYKMNPAAFWNRHEAAWMGFESLYESFADHGNFNILQEILWEYDIEISRKLIDAELEQKQKIERLGEDAKTIPFFSNTAPKVIRGGQR